jgi:VWFA-related protein
MGVSPVDLGFTRPPRACFDGGSAPEIRLKPSLAVALLALAGLSASPDAVAPADRDRPVFSSDVSLVVLPVFVVDGSGRAVRGLTAADFEVSEDGKRVPLASFRYVDTTSEEDQSEIREAPAARRRFLLLFDKSFTDLAGLNRARKAAAEFVRMRLSSSDLAAVATFDVNNGLRLAANFTDDRALLAHAVETLGSPEMARISDPLALRMDMPELDVQLGVRTGGGGATQLDVGGLSTVLVNRVRAAEMEAYRAHILTLIASLQDLARALRTVEGRKQVLYFSAGFDPRLLIGQTGEEQKMAAESSATGRLWEIDGATRFGDARVRDLLSEMTRDFTRSDSVIHAIDVTGLGRDGSLTQQYVTVDPVRDVGGRESLNMLSSETGGRFFKDTNDLQPVLREMLEMTSRYYILGFQPAKPEGPGALHKVKVRVGRKGVKVSHRPGYYERLPLTAKTPVLQRQFEAAELVMGGEGARNELRVSSLCLPLPTEGERQAVMLVAQVPTQVLEWSRGRPSSLEMYAYAVGDDGTVRDHLAQLVRLDPERRPAGEARGVSFHGIFSVPPGSYTLRMLLVERETGATGLQVLDLKVPPFDARAGFLLPPLVVEDAAQWVSLDMRRASGSQPASPFEVGGKRFVPRTSFEVKGGAAEKMVLVAFAPRRPADPSADVQLRSSLTAGDGRVVPAGMLRIDKVYWQDGGRRTFVLGYTPDAVDPGDYTLRIALDEGRERLESYSLLRVRPGL